ncbi:D-alanyl-D-alanine carboxypeptidase [Vibrio phage LP.2]|nr:D-alanyl-D-alanine carboxypeptidase [Vibrio phage LP.2]
MEHHRFSQSSLDKLAQAHPDLERVAVLALKYSKYDFGITESLRTIERQQELFKEGKSQTMNSRHLPNENGVSEAIDIKVYVGGQVVWEHRYFRRVIQAFVKAAIELGVQLEFGGLWETFIDSPHIQLPRA